MHYDLHVHSCLSPCAEEDMTVNNICQMAMIKGLDLIGISDHNSTKQLPAFAKAAQRLGIKAVYGCELESSEEVHVLALFNDLDKALSLQPWIDEHMPDIMNNPDFFGTQLILNDMDEVIGSEERLLVVSLKATMREIADAVHEHGGKVVLAHVLHHANAVIDTLGFIPKNFPFDGLEVRKESQKEAVLALHPWMKDRKIVWFRDSDAHQLVAINEAEADNDMDEAVFASFWKEMSL